MHICMPASEHDHPTATQVLTFLGLPSSPSPVRRLHSRRGVYVLRHQLQVSMFAETFTLAETFTETFPRLRKRKLSPETAFSGRLRLLERGYPFPSAWVEGYYKGS